MLLLLYKRFFKTLHMIKKKIAYEYKSARDGYEN